MNTKDVSVIDVRTPHEFAMGSVEGSINIPLDTLPSKLEEIRNMKKPLILCCASGVRSYNAYRYLLQQGFTGLYDGGAWNRVALQVGQFV